MANTNTSQGSTQGLFEELSAHPFLHGLSKEQMQRLLGCAKAGRYASGSFILREGGPADTLYLITAGRIFLEVQVPGRGAVRVETLESGDILGLHWMFPPQRWVLDARAVHEVSTVELAAGCVRRQMDDDPVLGYAISMRMLRQLCDRLERVRLQRLDVYKKDAGE